MSEKSKGAVTVGFSREMHERISARLRDFHARHPDYLNELDNQFRRKLEAAGIHAEVRTRERTPLTIWRTAQQEYSRVEYGEIFVIQLIMKDIEDCYKALGIVHTTWPVVPGRFGDYISSPRDDGYISLDTTIIGPGRERLKCQIRTKEIHEKVRHLESAADDPYALHLLMLDRIAALEEKLKSLPPPMPGIGHNQPPEPIESRPLEESDRQVILELIAGLRAQPVVTNEEPASIIDKSNRLKALGEKVLRYAADKTDVFVSEALKTAGQEVGKWAARLAIWSILGTLLIEVGQAALDWIKAVGATFF